MNLYKLDDIMDALNSTPDIKGIAYKEFHDKLMALKPAAVIRDCNGCMGPSYNPRDCESCEKVKVAE